MSLLLHNSVAIAKSTNRSLSDFALLSWYRSVAAKYRSTYSRKVRTYAHTHVRTFPSDHVPFRFQRILVILVTFATTVSAFMDNVVETKNSEYERCELALLSEIMNVTSVDIKGTNGACIDSHSVCKKSVGSADFKCIRLSSCSDLATFHLLKFPFFCSSTLGIKKETEQIMEKMVLSLDQRKTKTIKLSKVMVQGR